MQPLTSTSPLRPAGICFFLVFLLARPLRICVYSY